MERVKINRQTKALIEQEISRTGLGPQAILRGTRTNRPDGMSFGIIQAWRSGQIKTAREDHLEYLLERWRSMPNAITRLPMSEEIHMRIRTEIDRTGVGIVKLLKLFADEKPEGLSTSLLNNYSCGKGATVRVDYYMFAINSWAKLPNKV